MAPIGNISTKATEARIPCASLTAEKVDGRPPPLDPELEPPVVDPSFPSSSPDLLELGLGVDDAADAKNGFELLPPVALCKLKVVDPYLLCCARFAVTLSDETADPVLYAQIQFDEELVKLIDPPDQLLQFEPK